MMKDLNNSISNTNLNDTKKGLDKIEDRYAEVVKELENLKAENN